MAERVAKPWERQPNEGIKPYEAFDLYCKQGSNRSIRKVAQQLGKSAAIISRWSSAHDWRERVRAYDNEMKRLEMEEKKLSFRKMNERQIKAAGVLQAKAIEALKTLDLTTMRPRDIAAFISEGVRIERLIRQEEAVDEGTLATDSPENEKASQENLSQPSADRKYHLPAELVPSHFSELYRDILKRGHNEYLLAGGRGSAKSSFVAKVIPALMLNNPGLNFVVVRKIGNTLRTSVYNTIRWAIAELGLDEEFNFKLAPMEVSRISTGQAIYFFGLDDPLKLKSFKPRTGYCGGIWFEEFDQFAGMEEIRNVKQSLLRGGDEGYTFMTFNPPKSKTSFANIECDVPRDKRLVSKTTYLTVPPDWLGAAFLSEAEALKESNPTAYEHEYLGIPNGNGGMVFENVVGEEITDAQIRSFDRIYSGVDWGWFPDPWAFNRMHFDASRRTLYIYAELRGNKLSNEQTANMLKEFGLGAEDLITADSAEPKSIQDYRANGLYCQGAIKGPDSVRYSMKWLQSLIRIVIDPVRCPNTYKEFINYEYERTKDGEIMSAYPDKDNHQIDAVRYATESIWKWMGK